MFTGLVSDIGTVESVRPHGGGYRLAVRPRSMGVGNWLTGESIAISGCCLTVAAIDASTGAAAFDVVPETRERTTVGEWKAGTVVNLERALSLGDRLGGHLVLGHIDGIGEVLARQPEAPGERMTISLPKVIASLVAEKGSISVDGVSLTVARAHRDRFEVALIPETLSRTTLGNASVGTRVNLEADIVARHVARLREFQEV